MLAGVIVPALMQLEWIDANTAAYIASVVSALGGGAAQVVKPKQ